MFLKADDLLLLSLPQKMFFILDVVQGPFFVQIVPPQKKKNKKKTIFKSYQLFRTNGLQYKLLILIWKSVQKNKVGVVFGAN